MDPSDTMVYRLRAAGPQPLDWERVGAPWVEIKTVELALDNTKDMTRFQLLPPKLGTFSEDGERHRALRRLLEQWADLLTASKRAQMNVEDRSEWPPQSHMPWVVDTLENMPVVVWLRRQK
jgi:hypothetical protein